MSKKRKEKPGNLRVPCVFVVSKYSQAQNHLGYTRWLHTKIDTGITLS
jgi:hypothetical protein